MPGWHKQTKDLVAEGKLQVFGIAPEQYGDRMALFLQWKNLDFPVLMDPLNVLNVTAVPITLLVDESGVIRHRNPKAKDLETFLATDYPAPKGKRAQPTFHPLTEAMSQALIEKHSRQAQQALLLYQELVKTEELEPALSFQAGVVARWLYDEGEEAELFQTAVSYWQAALSEIPGQYIWRRRIQQYGPRLDKPYPFYNWVTVARKEILARGQEPLSLEVEPSGSELASPQRKNEQAKPPKPYPDSGNQLPNDAQSLVITTTLIPHTDDRDKGRLHLQLTPTKDSHWSSDAQELELWFQPAQGEPLFLSDEATLLPPDQETSSHSRTLEVDISKKSLQSGTLVLFSFLCDSEDPSCRFLKTEWKMKWKTE